MPQRAGIRPGTCFSAVLVVLLVVVSCLSGQAQVAGASLSGTLKDPSGALVPGAQVAIENTATGVVRNVSTNADGLYTAPNLIPGNYKLTISAPGFNTEVRTGVELTVGTQQVFDLTLQVGREKRRVEVTSEAPTVQLATSDISAVVNGTTVRELPLNGRSWTDLATLQPGVDAIQTQPTFAVGADRGNRGFGSQVTISGARPQQNNYRLDGISLNDYANGAPGSVLGGNLGVDAIQEFSVLTSNYSAEYGKSSGGVVNAISRSGTNGFHGGGYEFLRNSALDARNFFDAKTIPPFKRNQFGGSIGGPIIKDRTFFFADYEGVRQSKGITTLNTVPSLDARNGILHNSDGSISHVAIDPSARAYLTFFPLPNAGPTDDPNIFKSTFAGQQVVNENFFTTRVDHKLSQKDSLFATYLYDKTPYHSPDGLNNVLLGSETSRQIAAVEYTRIFTPAFVNTVRLGYNHERVANDQSLSAINPAAADTSLGAMPGRDAAQVFISGISPFTGGIGGNPTYFYHWNSAQVYDDASHTVGTHSLKFGMAYERLMLNLSALSNPNGVFRFGNLESFFSNKPKTFNSGIASTLTPRNLRQNLFGVYLQDDWRWRPNLTLNLGMRYEISSVPTETSGKLSNLLHLSDATPHLGNPYFLNPTLRNFEPRVGFAYDPFRTGKTAIRGGFGMFDVQPLLYQFTLLSSLAAPFFELGSVHPPAGSFFTGAGPLLTANSLRATFIEHQPKRNYVMQWNLDVQQEITNSLSAMIGYVGSRGVHQPFRVDDADLVLPTKTAAGYVWPVPVASGTTVNPNFGSVRGMFYRGDSYYDALEVGVTKRLSHGVQFQGSYTWGKSIDTSSATLAGDAFGNSISSLDFFDYRLSRGLSDFSIGRTLVLNGTWFVPSPNNAPQPLRWLLGGWEVGAIYKASDGVPFSPTFGTDGDRLGLNSGDPYDFPNRLGGAGCSSLSNPGNPNNYIKTGCFAVPTAPSTAFYNQFCDPAFGVFPQCFNLRGNAGRNIIIGPGLSNLDFSLFKNNRIRSVSETFNVQFRAEFFNVLNRTNFAPPALPDHTDIFDSTGAPNGVAGLLTSTTTTAREIQFGIKVNW